MKRQQYLAHRLQTLAALRDAVGAMRSLSAHHFRQVRQGLAPARVYREEMNTVVAKIGIRQRLQLNLPAGLLVLASDLGLCGDYNARLVRLAREKAARLNATTIYAVGRRVRTALLKTSPEPRREYDAPASLSGISQLLIGLAEDILEDYLHFRIGSLQVISAGFNGIGKFTPLSVRVLPVEPIEAADPLRRSPYHAAKHLTFVAVREFLYITLFEIVLDGLAAEHGMRLMAAEAALEWLDSTAETTARRLRTARGEASTQELLDIVAGRGRHADGD